MIHRLLRSLCVSFLCAGLAACGVEAPAEAPAPENSPPSAPAEMTPHSERAGIGMEPEFNERTLSQLAGVIDPRKTLAVTDQTILINFPLQSVFNQLATQNGATGFTALQLFRQLWDTQNPAPGQADLHAVTNYAHCTDNSNTLNGFPYACRTAEGADALDTTSASMNAYKAVGLYNRFDLAPSTGANCGEYRIVYARSTGGRNFIIFEAVLPNPQPALGIEGCRPIANFWRNLSDDTSAASRATKLFKFYFQGLDATTNQVISMPVVHLDNYGNRTGNTGQVRTNQFRGGPWMLHEFQTQRTCATSSSCILKFVPVTVKTNPFGGLFNPASTDPRAASFQSHFLTQVASLAVNDINTFGYEVPNTFNGGQSDAQSDGGPDNYRAQFGTGASTFRTNIQTQLTAIGSTLTPDQIVSRAQSQSCGGCHQRSNNAPLGGGLTFPLSSGFVHSTEFTETGPDGTRFVISPALTGTFLPHRQQVLANFLDTPVRNATFVSQSVPTTVTAGQAFTVSITMKNTGTQAWTAGQAFRLGSQNPQDNGTWGQTRVFLGPVDTIHLGQQKTFTFTAFAPSTPGFYAFQWRMLQESVVWFGDFTPSVNILVTSNCSCPAGQTCPDVVCPEPQ
ncbi:NBR1-Ig-like domain-containing protein [Hyalangium versicolor]|uniref:NBR1-Ig-like domain-containing protein n=1 Tax=Hyalangium versicolor TaxID=2861190 RepID=UPI001CCE6EA3|nr:NBR1-Ig-like domain-containing protein [Hyalangium versicolor]